MLTLGPRSTIGVLANTIVPRTDSPGATDVGVPAFIDVIGGEYYTDAERAEFTTGIEAIDARAVSMSGLIFVSLTNSSLVRVMNA